MNSQKIQKIFEAKDYAGVMQDKSARLANRPALDQGYRPQEEIRVSKKAVQSDDPPISPDSTQAPQNQRHTHPKESLVPLTTQIPVFIKAEIQRRAQHEEMSTSATAAALLERAVQTQIDMQYGAMLRPVIAECVKREINARIDRTNQLALNAFLAGEQGRVLTIHVLSLLLTGGGDALPQLVKDSQKQAWANLRYLMGQKEGEEN